MSTQDTRTLLPVFGSRGLHLFAPLQRDIDRVFADFGREAGRSGFDAPSLDFAETADGVELKLDVPGYKENDISITLNGDVLTVAGKTSTQTEEADKTYHLVERRSGAFSRSVVMPLAVDADKVRASLSDGVLTITAPKAAAMAGKTIAIEAKPASAA
ncbi:MAG: Hsp20/alpha crystallin family protein [Caulobacter sp.]|nr:Hsp20/alpha crystallin family protein [Caulobacter sp.]